MKTGRIARPVPFRKVQIKDSFWVQRQNMLQTHGLHYQYQELLKQGCPTAFLWKPGMPDESWRFRDSDMAKWIEAASFSLASQPDPRLEKWIDDYVATLAPAQHEDGYLCSYYGLVKTEEKYTNLRSNHELYRMGHMIEAAIEYHAATGKRAFLDIMIRCALGMGETFGHEPGKKRGYCGHEVLEMALVRLYQHTGDKRHLDLALYFVNERGQKPSYFELEAQAREEKPSKDNYDYFQAHKPVREQDKPVGHAVRAVYLYAAMADLALEAHDESLMPPLRKLWREILDYQLYIHGGIGQTVYGERFTFPYDLPNETAYAETCAAIGMLFWAHRMLQLEPRGEYGDIMERVLFNSIATGVSLSGERYSYAHPLTVFPGTDPHQKTPHSNPKHLHGRYPWFEVPCCPPNLARVLLSLGGYAYTSNADSVWVHLYLAGTATVKMGDREIGLNISTDYPWDGKITIRLSDVDSPLQTAPENSSLETRRPRRVLDSSGTPFTLNLRIPAWCKKPSLKINGRTSPLRIKEGYAAIKAKWKLGDSVQLDLPMPIEFIETHPNVWQNAGRAALQRGPVLYCFEQADNGPNLMELTIQRRSMKIQRKPKLLNGVPVITGKATTRAAKGWKNTLYQAAPTQRTTTAITAVPYCLWGNRAPGNMTVWMQTD